MRHFLTLGSVNAALIALLLTGCSKTSPPTASPLANLNPSPPIAESAGEKNARQLAETTGNPYWEKRWWLEKTARRLRGGKELSPADNPDELMKLSEDEIIRRFMNDEHFGDAILDFNSYFLGFKFDVTSGDPGANSLLADFTPVIASAQEMLKDGDYYRLFDLTGAPFVSPLDSVNRAKDEEKLSNAEVRKKHAAELQAIVQAAIDLAQATNASSEQVCKFLKDNSRETIRLQSDGYPFSIVILGILINPDWVGRLDAMCGAKPLPTPAELASALSSIYAKNQAFFGEMQRFEPANGYKVTRIADYRAVNLEALGLSRHWPAMGLIQASAIRNSSTNMNRKRAAYVLKHFFCDDLTPLGFEIPDEHTGGAHGSDTSCYACHFKLDPMAGFFKSYGLFMTPYHPFKTLVFDDMATTDREQYEKNWRAPEGSARTWNIGYIRSPGAGADNLYGENLEDLSRIIRSAPEAKLCLVRRLFEYFVAPNQTVDAGYLHDLSEKLVKESAQSPSVAVKNVIARLLTSRAYHEHDLDPKRCYDRAPGDTGQDPLPCRVSYLLRENCVGCHNGGVLSDSTLDLSHWIDTGQGVFSFPHLDASGHQRPPRDTFAAIIERLSTADPKKRMPKKALSNQDRREIYGWAQDVYGTLP